VIDAFAVFDDPDIERGSLLFCQCDGVGQSGWISADDQALKRKGVGLSAGSGLLRIMLMFG